MPEFVESKSSLSYSKMATAGRFEHLCLHKVAFCPCNSIVEFRLYPAWKQFFHVRFRQSHGLGNCVSRLLHRMFFSICCKIKQRPEETLKIRHCHWSFPFSAQRTHCNGERCLATYLLSTLT